MRQHEMLLLLASLLFGSLAPTGASAQTLSLDSVTPISLTTSSTVSAWSADVATGNVRARSAAGTLQNCSGQSGGGTPAVTLDNVTPISLAASTSVSAWSVDVATGNVTARSAGNIQNCSSGGGGTAPTINSFAPASGTVEPSTMISLSWTTTNASSCTPLQGGSTDWSTLGTLPSTGSRQFDAPGNTGTVTFELRCVNGSLNATATTQVSVQVLGGNCAATYPNGTVLTWNSLFGNGGQSPWPSYGVRTRPTVPFNGYLAFQFTATNQVGQFGTVVTADFPGDGDGWGQMSISRTPGCFTASQVGPNCLSSVSRFVSVGWANGSSVFSCALTHGQTYYVNLTYGGTTVGPGPHCPTGGPCSADVAQFQQTID